MTHVFPAKWEMKLLMVGTFTETISETPEGPEDCGCFLPIFLMLDQPFVQLSAERLPEASISITWSKCPPSPVPSYAVSPVPAWRGFQILSWDHWEGTWAFYQSLMLHNSRGWGKSTFQQRGKGTDIPRSYVAAALPQMPQEETRTPVELSTKNPK